MKSKKWTKIALSALATSGGLTLTFNSCDKHSDKKSVDLDKTANEAQSMMYKELHDCSGQNSCRGLGGCKVSRTKLASLAGKRGISIEKAGMPHDCAGKNSCKGLGGCAITAEKLIELKQNLKH